MTNYLIVFPLIIIACIAGFYQLFTISTINFSKEQTIPTGIPNTNDIPAFQGRTLWQNQLGIGSSMSTADNDAKIAVEMTSGVIAVIIGATAIAITAGIKLFGSGLSENSVRTIYRATVYYGLWGIFSALSYPFFLAFPLFIGAFGWFMLTLVYSLGYFEVV